MEQVLLDLAKTVLETSPQLAIAALVIWIHYKLMKEMLSIIKGKDDTES